MNLESSDEHFCKGICASTEEDKVNIIGVSQILNTWQCMVLKDGKQQNKQVSQAKVLWLSGSGPAYGIGASIWYPPGAYKNKQKRNQFLLLKY